MKLFAYSYTDPLGNPSTAFPTLYFFSSAPYQKNKIEMIQISSAKLPGIIKFSGGKVAEINDPMEAFDLLEQIKKAINDWDQLNKDWPILFEKAIERFQLRNFVQGLDTKCKTGDKEWK